MKTEERKKIKQKQTDVILEECFRLREKVEHWVRKKISTKTPKKNKK